MNTHIDVTVANLHPKVQASLNQGYRQGATTETLQHLMLVLIADALQRLADRGA